MCGAGNGMAWYGKLNEGLKGAAEDDRPGVEMVLYFFDAGCHSVVLHYCSCSHVVSI